MATVYVTGGTATLKGSIELEIPLEGWAVDGTSKEDVEKQIKERLEKDARDTFGLPNLVKTASDYELHSVGITVDAKTETESD